MKRITITKIITAAIGLLLCNLPAQSQTSLGAACGCPSVASRPTVLMSTLAVSGGATDGDLLASNTILSCDKTYILDKKIYVPDGKSLTINPGTVVKGRFQALATNATALVVQRGGKIFANGNEDCQIVFTAEADNLDGTFPIGTIGQWGGILIAGKATNNLTLAANGPFQAGVGDGKLCVADGIGTFEGFASSNSRDQFGATPASFDDNDNSGILKYVSIRHSGAILQVGGEINGLTLGSVGRGTTIDHIEIVSCADDGIEFFGGTVNVKYYSNLFGNDDMFDWDDGYTGKCQFIFGLKSNGNSSLDADNAFEMDGDDQKSNLLPRSHPIIYNATVIGNTKSTPTSDNSGIAALRAKELTEGEIYNSVFANFRYGFNVTKALGTRSNVAGQGEAWANWANAGGNGSQSLKVKCNTFVNTTQSFALDGNGSGGFGSTTDTAQFRTTDLNSVVASVPGFDYAFTINPTTNAVTDQVDAVPNPALSTAGCPTAPVDGFYSSANYRGAFDPSAKSWLSDWTYTSLVSVVNGLQPCPTDLNGDGITNNIDFLQLLGKFNQSCQ